MTTVRGKAPLVLTDCPSVEAWTTSQKVVVTTGGWCGEHDSTAFTAMGELSVSCAKNLILELRKALRRIRDETTERLNNAVTEAEKPL